MYERCNLDKVVSLCIANDVRLSKAGDGKADLIRRGWIWIDKVVKLRYQGKNCSACKSMTTWQK